MPVLFISGINTGVGKTMATGLIARAFLSRGLDCITVKMVQTGCDGFSEDLDAHREMMGCGRFPEDDEGLTAPQIFKFPASALLASRMEGKTTDLGAISTAVAECARRHKYVLVEGAGGMLVPLTEDVLAADFAASQGWPLLLVSSGKLGSVNHTLLSLEAAVARGMRVAGVVYNFCPDADPAIDEDSFFEIKRHLRRMGLPETIVRIPQVIPGRPLPDIDVEPLLGNL